MQTEEEGHRLEQKSSQRGGPSNGGPAFLFEIDLGFSCMVESNLVYPNSKIRVPKGSKNMNIMGKSRFFDFNPSNLDLTSAPCSRIMLSLFCISKKTTRITPKTQTMQFPFIDY